MRKPALIVLGGVGLVSGVFIAGCGLVSFELSQLVGGLALVVAGTVLLMDGLL